MLLAVAALSIAELSAFWITVMDLHPAIKPTRSLLLVVCLSARCWAADPFDHLSIIPISDGNPSTNESGWANVAINATSFKNQSLVTVEHYQFTSYYGADQKLIVGRRDLNDPSGTWYLRRTEFTSRNINDVHNVSTIGIDGDGFLHLAWGVHNQPLLYTRSTTSVINDSSFALTGDAVGNSGMLAGVIPLQTNSITYPEFLHVPDGSGDLLLTYRTGGSGNGEYQLARWNNANTGANANSWINVHAVQNSGNGNLGPQPWIDNDFNSSQSPPNVNAYHNGLVYDSTGRLHVTWTWRTGSDSTAGFTGYQTNHNLMYAYSDNHGVDWHKADGTLYQRNGVHDIDENNATPVFLIPEGSSLINQTSSVVGSDGTFYTATWYAPDAAQNVHTRQYMLIEYDGTDWKYHQIGNRAAENGNNRLSENQLGSFEMSRPIVMTDDQNRVFVVYSDWQRGQGVTVAYSESLSRDDWKFIDLVTDQDLTFWEPKYDLLRWERDGVLSMLLQPVGDSFNSSTMSILEWNAREYFASAPEPSLVQMLMSVLGIGFYRLRSVTTTLSKKQKSGVS